MLYTYINSIFKYTINNFYHNYIDGMIASSYCSIDIRTHTLPRWFKYPVQHHMSVRTIHTCTNFTPVAHRCRSAENAITNLSEPVGVIDNAGKNQTCHNEYHIPSRTCLFYVRFLNAVNIF